jgi:hypothetical protein
MKPGERCLECHGGASRPGAGGGGGEHGDEEGDDDGPRWSLAGTVYASPNAPERSGIQGARVQVTDARGSSFGLTSNLAGNFYSAESVTFPLTVCVERAGRRSCMGDPVPHGDCNACHAPGGEADGRIVAP